MDNFATIYQFFTMLRIEISMPVLADNFTRQGRGAGENFSARIDTGVDTGVYVFAGNDSQFSPVGGDQFAVDFRMVLQIIVPQISGYGAGSEIYRSADNGVADIT